MPQNTTRSLTCTGLLALSLAALATLDLGCAPTEAKAEGRAPDRAVTVLDARATRADVPRYLVLTGTLRGEREAQITADTSGKVIATLVERGELVRSGSPVVRVDPAMAAIGQSEAVALAAAARAEETQAKADCERAERLFADSAISRAEYEGLLTACSARTHSAAAASAREARSVRSLGDATIRAPFDGVVGERLVTIGEYVRPGSAVATVAQVDSLRLQLTVPESAVPAVRVGQKVAFDVGAFPGESFEGTLRYVSGSLDPVTRSLVVEATVPNASARLRPGMFATARLIVGSDSRVVVPTESLVGEGRNRRLFVIHDRRLEERVVLVGEGLPGRTAILSGLADGERVAARPDETTRDGLTVQ